MMGRKPKRGRYTPRKDRSEAGSPKGAMSLRSARVGPEHPEARRSAEEEFLRGAIFPQRLTLLRPSARGPGERAGADPGAAGLVVALVDPDEVDADMRRLLHGRAGEVDPRRWSDSVRGTAGWTTLASISGDPTADAEASFAKLNFELTAPIGYKASFVFHLSQSRVLVRALV
ncbi:MAG: hypothetical protein M3011_10555, partial [Actinomycetota bacterium]|nr:hypothetical protein [Actinomycetota bacterium]